MPNYRPAGESSDEDYDDKYGGFSFGYDAMDDTYESRSARLRRVFVNYSIH